MELTIAIEAMDINNAGLPGRMAAVLPHLEAVGAAAGARESPNVSTLLNALGQHYFYVADYARAHAAFERALVIRMRFLGADHLHTQIARGNLEIVERHIAAGQPPPPTP